MSEAYSALLIKVYHNNVGYRGICTFPRSNCGANGTFVEEKCKNGIDACFVTGLFIPERPIYYTYRDFLEGAGIDIQRIALGTLLIFVETLRSSVVGVYRVAASGHTNGSGEHREHRGMIYFRAEPESLIVLGDVSLPLRNALPNRALTKLPAALPLTGQETSALLELIAERVPSQAPAVTHLRDLLLGQDLAETDKLKVEGGVVDVPAVAGVEVLPSEMADEPIVPPVEPIQALLIELPSKAVKPRLSIEEFHAVLDSLLGDARIDDVVETMRSGGVATKHNVKFIRESFVQNVFHVARFLHWKVFVELWLRHAVKQANVSAVLQLLVRTGQSGGLPPPWNVPSPFLAGRTLGEVLADATAEVGDTRLHELLALVASDALYGEYLRWLHRGILPSTISVEADISPKQPATEAPQAAAIDIPGHNLLVSHAHSTEVHANTGDTNALSAPALRADALIASAIQRSNQIQELVAPLVGLRVETLQPQELRARANTLRRLGELHDDVAAEVELAGRTANLDVEQTAEWLGRRGVPTNDACVRAMHAATACEPLQAAYASFVNWRYQAIEEVGARTRALQVQVGQIEELFSSYQELPPVQIDHWRQSIETAVQFADKAKLDDLYADIKAKVAQIIHVRQQRDVDARIAAIRQRMGAVPYLANQASIDRKLDRIAAEKGTDLDRCLEDIQMLEELLPVVSSAKVTAATPSIRILNDFFSTTVALSGNKRAVLLIPSAPNQLRVPICLELSEPASSSVEIPIQVRAEGAIFTGSSEDRRTYSAVVKFQPGMRRVEHIVSMSLSDSARRRLMERKAGLHLRVSTSSATADLTWDPIFLRTVPTDGMSIKNPLDIASPSGSDIARLQLGVETRLESILSWAQKGRGHIYIAAPRRFGKTSVTKYCEAKLSKLDGLSIVRVDCSGLHGKRGQILKLVVRAIARAIGHNEGDCDALDRWQDSVDDWQRLERVLLEEQRRAAHRKKLERIVVLVDEAQALFARLVPGSAFDFADRMKTFLEHAAGEHEGQTPIYFGFFGRLNLRQLLGQNLRDSFINPSASIIELSDDEVGSVLRSINAEIQSTPEARDRLKDWGINLVFLRDLFGSLCEILSREQRLFVVREDVEKAIQSLREHRDIFNYLRDLLNRSDDTNQWQPVRGYPVAVAMACAARDDELVELGSVENRLSQLVGGESARVELIRDVLNDEEISDVVERKGELVRIKAEPLRLYLRARVNESPDELRRCFAEMVLPEIELPASLELVRKGGQADLYRGVVEKVECAVRKLLPEASPVRFQREILALRKLGQRRAPGIPAFQSLPEFVTHGRTVQDGRLVVACKWVDGVSLREQMKRCAPGGLPASLVRKAIHQVAGALAIVHEHDLMHRDVKPENILLSTQGVAVLIDFGLVRSVNTSSAPTNAGTEGYIPRVGQGTASGDLYALARTACALLGGGESEHELATGRQIIERDWGVAALQAIDMALRSDTPDRGSARELSAVLAPATAAPSEFVALRSEVQQKLPDQPLERVRASLTTAMAFADGVSDSNLRLVVCAALASDLFDCFLKQHLHTKLSTYSLTLASLEDHQSELATLGVRFSREQARQLQAVAQLRNGFGHWNSLADQIQKATRTLGNGGKLRSVVSEALRLVTTWLQLGPTQSEQRRELIMKIGQSILGR